MTTALKDAMKQPAPSPDDWDAVQIELARLRQENELLRRGGGGFRLDDRPGERKKYRVRLPSIQHRDGRISYVRVLVTTHQVGPKERLPGQPPLPANLAALPTKDYDALALLIETGEKDTAAVAWRKYQQEHSIADRDRVFFTVKPRTNTKPQDYLDVEAVSPSDAFSTYCKYAGVVSTVQIPQIEPVNGQH